MGPRDVNGSTDADYRPARWAGFREDYRFTGKEEDIEVGLTYFGARYLNTNLRRWISPDPLTIHASAGDSDPYAYVAGKVLAAVDLFGLEIFDVVHHANGYWSWQDSNIKGDDGQPIVQAGETAEYQEALGIVPDVVRQPVAQPGCNCGREWGRSGVRFDSNNDHTNVVAKDLKSAGYGNLAAIAEAGHGCALCHVIKGYRSLGEADAAVNLREYNGLARELSNQRDLLAFTLVSELVLTRFVFVVRIGTAESAVVSSGAARRALGHAREVRVAAATGGVVDGTKIWAPSLGKTDIDVIAGNGDLVMVGGPAKANDFGNLGRVVKLYQGEAARRGVGVRAYFAEGTPQSVRDFVGKRIGGGNVFKIPE